MLIIYCMYSVFFTCCPCKSPGSCSCSNSGTMEFRKISLVQKYMINWIKGISFKKEEKDCNFLYQGENEKNLQQMLLTQKKPIYRHQKILNSIYSSRRFKSQRVYRPHYTNKFLYSYIYSSNNQMQIILTFIMTKKNVKIEEMLKDSHFLKTYYKYMFFLNKFLSLTKNTC